MRLAARRRRVVAAGAAVAALAAATVIGMPGAAEAAVTPPPAEAVGCDTAGPALYRVPAGVTRVVVVAAGASGGRKTTTSTVDGGRGAVVRATLPVVPNQALAIRAGCEGGLIPAGSTGFTPGGSGGASESRDGTAGGQGGASSGVADCPSGIAAQCTATSLGTVVRLVAGGGGGAGDVSGPGRAAAPGGAGGCGGSPACAGSQGGGTRRVPGGAGGGAPAGALGAGSNGSDYSGALGGGGGGGGGGGWPRGGSGGGGGECRLCGGGGGGGGSSFAESRATNVSVTNGGAGAGNGYVVIFPVHPRFADLTVATVSCTGGSVAWTVPARTEGLQAALFGAKGADFGGKAPAGHGAAVATNLSAAVPGQALGVSAGCSTSGRDGGFGWSRGGSAPTGLEASGGGGGSTGVYAAGNGDLASRTWAVAGGGGGPGRDRVVDWTAAGWSHELRTADGQPGRRGGAVQSPGAGGGYGLAPGSDGQTATSGRIATGGGGGGGWIGGGAGGSASGAAGGGGAGTSYCRPNATARCTQTLGAGLTDGLVIFAAAVLGPPQAPAGVTAVAGLNRATISFTPPAVDGGQAPTRYVVTSQPDGRQAVSSGSPVTVTDLTPGTAFRFTVVAQNSQGVSPPSAPSNAVVPYRLPGAPLLDAVATTGTSATVTFRPDAADVRLGNPITGFTVEAREGVNVVTGPVAASASGPASPLTLTGLTLGRNYTIVVTARNAAGTGPASAPSVIGVRTLPGAPTDLYAVNATDDGETIGSARVSFTPPASDGGSPIRGYVVTASPGGIQAFGGDTSVKVTGLEIGTTYTFTARARTEVGDGPESDPSNEVTPTPVGKPSPPLTPSAAVQNQGAYVSCSPPLDDGGSPIVSYEVRSSPGGVTNSRSSCPIYVRGLTNGVPYTFTVTARNAAGGVSEPSAPSAPVTPRVPAGGPPSNDAFAAAAPISGPSGEITGSNVGATREDGEPSIQDRSGGASVWFRWTTPQDGGEYRFETCTQYPGMASQIQGFLGNGVTSLTDWGSGPNTEDCPPGQGGAFVHMLAPQGIQTLNIKLDGLNENDGAGASQGVYTLRWYRVG